MNKQVLHIISGDLWGGREVQVLLQLEALRARGCDAQALLFNDKETFIRFRAANIPVKLVSEQLGMRTLIEQAKSVTAHAHPALLVSHGYKEAVLAWRLSVAYACPWVATFHGASESYQGFAAWKKGTYQFVHRMLARYSAAKVVIVSSALAKQLRFSSMKKLEVIYNVAPLPNTTVAGTTNTELKAVSPARLAIVGRLVPVKRVDRAINAFAAFRQSNPDVAAELLVIGDGPLRLNLERMAATLPKSVNIEFLGQREDARDLLSQADVLMIASDSEGIPTVLLEAISYGVPVLSTDVGGISEVLQLLPGYPARLVSPLGSIREFAEAIAQVLANCKNAGHKYDELFQATFAPEVAAQKHERLYASLLTGQ